MKEPFVKDHYHDTGEHAINRGLDGYMTMIFPEEGIHWLRVKPKNMTPKNPMEWSMRHNHTLEHYIPKNKGIRFYKDSSIQYEWNWEEGVIFGGSENFFAPGSLILDLGSGTGKAVQDINKRYGSRGVRCFGVDYRYSQKRPHTVANLVAGDFANLPFGENEFDRVLAVESFPCWLPDEEVSIDQYFKEITRVSMLGSVWRGTLPTYSEPEEVIFPTDRIVRKFVENGWEVFVHGAAFSAKLAIKNSE